MEGGQFRGNPFAIYAQNVFSIEFIDKLKMCLPNQTRIKAHTKKNNKLMH